MNDAVPTRRYGSVFNRRRHPLPVRRTIILIPAAGSDQRLLAYSTAA